MKRDPQKDLPAPRGITIAEAAARFPRSQQKAAFP